MGGGRGAGGAGKEGGLLLGFDGALPIAGPVGGWLTPPPGPRAVAAAPAVRIMLSTATHGSLNSGPSPAIPSPGQPAGYSRSRRVRHVLRHLIRHVDICADHAGFLRPRNWLSGVRPARTVRLPAQR